MLDRNLYIDKYYTFALACRFHHASFVSRLYLEKIFFIGKRVKIFFSPYLRNLTIFAQVPQVFKVSPSTRSVFEQRLNKQIRTQSESDSGSDGLYDSLG